MRVLLSGAAGFIGAAVHDALTAAGHDVVPVDLMLPQAHGLAPAPAGIHRLDIREAVVSPVWARLLEGIDAVCHQAALVGIEASPADLPAYAAHNDLGTAALLAAMAERGVGRLILASSMVVYGEGRYGCPDHGTQVPGARHISDLDAGAFENRCRICGTDLAWRPVEEDTPLAPRSGYAASKAAQEHYAAAWSRHCSARVVALRYHNVYGPGMPRDTSYCGVAAMFRSRVERGLAPLVHEDGRQTRDFVHVDDVAEANVHALDKVDAVAERGALSAYNIASGRPVTIAEVASALARETGISPVRTGTYRLGDVRHIVASPAKAERELGFRARVEPSTGLRAFAGAPLRGGAT